MAAVIRFVNTASTAGGDGTTNNTTGATRAYASLNEWESNEQTDLVTDTDTHTVNCSGVAADVLKTSIVGWTTNVSFFITINGNNTSGVYNTSAHRIEWTTAGASQFGLSIEEDFTVVNDMQVFTAHVSGAHSFCFAYRFTANKEAELNRCIARASGTTAGNFSGGVKDNTSNAGNNYLTNCLIYDFDFTNNEGQGFQRPSRAAGGTIVRNCTVVGCDNGFSGQADSTFINNLASACSQQGYGGSVSGSSNKNASSLGDAFGTNPIDTVSNLTFKDAAADDFRPLQGTTADDLVIRAGEDLSGVFTDDLAGTARVAGTYTIGALVAFLSTTFAELTHDDAMRRALGVAGFTGTLHDRLMQWLVAEGHTTGTLNDKWLQFLVAAGFTTGTVNDRLLAYYISLGADASSTLTEAERFVWFNSPPT